MSQFTEAQVWSAINGQRHTSLSNEQSQISAFEPLISALFPGIDYYSLAGFHTLMADRVRPVLARTHPEIADLAEADVNPGRLVGVGPFLPSEGYEHSESAEWRAKFQSRLDNYRC